MKIALAIVSMVMGLFFLGSTVRMFPLGTVRAFFVRPTTLADVVNGTLTVLLFVVTGVMLLFDAHDPVKRGGTGRVVDWTTAATVARERRIVLAGGLTPDNVADAVAAVQPFGIDVSSGVELSPGIKDERRMAALFAAIQRSRVSTV